MSVQSLHYSCSGLTGLQWPVWRKYTVLTSMSLFAFVANFGSAAVAPAIPILQYQLVAFQEPLRGPPVLLPYSKLSHLIAVNVLLIGISNIIWVPVANTYGRRPVLIASMTLALLASVWAGAATSFSSLLAARAVQGLGFGPADAVSPESVGEVFFVHQRGRAMVNLEPSLAAFEADKFVGHLHDLSLGRQFRWRARRSLHRRQSWLQIYLLDNHGTTRCQSRSPIGSCPGNSVRPTDQRIKRTRRRHYSKLSWCRERDWGGDCRAHRAC